MSSVPLLAPRVDHTVTSKPDVGSRAWMADVMQETLRGNPCKDLVSAIWLDLQSCTLEESLCDLAINALLTIRYQIDGSSAVKVWDEVNALRKAGQKEYARSSEDAFANFKRVGEALGIDPKDVLCVYLAKHLDGIQSHLDGHTSQREPVQGRINDAIVYFCLLKGMVRAGV